MLYDLAAQCAYVQLCLQYFSKLRTAKRSCAMKNTKKMNVKTKLPDSTEVRDTKHSNFGSTCCIFATRNSLKS